MTHITEARVIGNHADMGGSAPAAARRSVKRREMVAARAAWDSEGGATGDNEPLSDGPGGRAPRGLGR